MSWLMMLGQDIIQGEYFFDADLGVGKNNTVVFTPLNDGVFHFSVGLKNVTPGYHKFYIRVKDSDGKWSFTSRRNIEVPPIYSKTTIVGGEYFIDKDPGFGQGTPMIVSSPDSAILQNFNVLTASLTDGYHKLYGRVLDNTGRWGLTFRRNIEIYQNNENKIFKVEYFFDEDAGVGNCTSTILASPAADGSFQISIPRSTIPTGSDSLFLRVQDDKDGKWSMTEAANITTALPLALVNFNVVKEKNNAHLIWRTVDEANTSSFAIQRSENGIQFKTIGKLAAKNLRDLKNDYFYLDNISGIGADVIYYRLKITDVDSSYTYSPIVHIFAGEDDDGISLYPNPAHDYFVISGNAGTSESYIKIVVKDLSGRTLINKVLESRSEKRIIVSSLTRGLYLVNIINGDSRVTKKLIIK